MVTDVALATAHVSVVVSPARIDSGAASNVTTGGGATVTVTVAVVDPPGPVTVI